MKKKLFLLNSLLTFLLLTGVSFNVISCNSNSTKQVTTSNEDTEKIIQQKISLIKQKIKLIIDDYTTNFENEHNSEWLVDLEQVQSGSEKVSILKKAVEQIKSPSDNKKISDIDLDLDEMIKENITQLFKYVTNEIKLDNTLDVPEDFQIEIENNVVPILTNFTSGNFMKTLKKLLDTKLSENSFSNIYQNSLESKEDNNIESLRPDIFKVNTDLYYKFSYAGISESDEYKQCEILLTGDIKSTGAVKKYANEQILEILNNLSKKEILLYGYHSIKNYENLIFKFNWDFTDQEVQDELINVKLSAINSVIKKNKKLLETLEYDQEAIKFELLDKMDFSNENVKKPLTKDDNTINLVYGTDKSPKVTSFSSMKRNFLKHFGIKEREKNAPSGTEMYYFTEDTNWDGGEVNKQYIENLKKAGKTKEFYKNNQYLVGYGNFILTNISFSGMRLSPIKLDFNLTVEQTAFNDMVEKLLQYFEGLISVLQNTDAKGKPGFALIGTGSWITDPNKKYYMIRWKFYDKEWQKIMYEAKQKKDVSFNWIMENVIYKMRAEKICNHSSTSKVCNILDLKNMKKNPTWFIKEQ